MNIENFWNDIITQNRQSLFSYFLNDAIIRWHCTNEEFTVKEYIKVNCDYPGTWYGEIEKLFELDSKIILIGKVQSDDKKISCHVTSIITLCDDKIIEMDEYWADDGDVPNWRKELGIGKPIL